MIAYVSPQDNIDARVSRIALLPLGSARPHAGEAGFELDQCGYALRETR